jgi:signal transduction histidine kinase
MDEAQGTRLIFDLFESSGIGLVGLDDDGVIVEANQNVGVYLGLAPAEVLGQRATILRPAIRSREFWDAFPGTFYCLAPGPQNLLLIVSRKLAADAHGARIKRAIILRPYSLEREFARMRVCLNNYLAHEVASRLNSIGIASEFIAEPELRDNVSTREAFIATFRHDVEELNTLFVALLETAEQLALANRVARTPVDWRSLVEDLVAKIRGLASDRSASLSCTLPPHLPSPSGDYHWLYLGLFGVLAHALRSAPALTEVTVEARGTANAVETVVVVKRGDQPSLGTWPSPALFPLDDQHPRIGRLEIDEVAVTRAIFLLHGGDLRATETADSVEYSVVLPA